MYLLLLSCLGVSKVGSCPFISRQLLYDSMSTEHLQGITQCVCCHCANEIAYFH